MNLDEALTYARDVGLTDRQIAAAVQAAAGAEQFRRDKGLVTLTHPETGGEFDAHPDTVEQWQKAGWQRKEPPVEETAPEPEPEPEPAPKPTKRSK